MLIFLQTSIFESPAQTLVNTVNTVGVMGKGIAKTFREKYPQMFREYHQFCKAEKLQVGHLHLWRDNPKWILNFPTKTTWRRPSEIEYIEAGLKKFVQTYEQVGIRSISFPPLGCGNGNLNWHDVKPIMVHYLKDLPIDIYIHDYQVENNFIPEHLESKTAFPISAQDFILDIKKIIQKNKGTFWDLLDNHPFHAYFYDDDLKIEDDQQTQILDDTEIIFEKIWSQVQKGIFTDEYFSNALEKKNNDYLISILKELPYLNLAKYHYHTKENIDHFAVFLKSSKSDTQEVTTESSSKVPQQASLWG